LVGWLPWDQDGPGVLGGGLPGDHAGRWVVGGSLDDDHDESEGSSWSSVDPLAELQDDAPDAEPASSATCVPHRGHAADPSAM
jgi:hypothetical protein